MISIFNKKNVEKSNHGSTFSGKTKFVAKLEYEYFIQCTGGNQLYFTYKEF